MNTVRIFLTWGGVGVAVGLGIVAVIAVAVKLCSLYDKLFPKKNLPAYDFLEKELNSLGRDYIVFSYDLKLISGLIKEKMEKLRKELWEKDLVLPNVSICTAKFPAGKNCIIRLEGKELFNGEIEHHKGFRYELPDSLVAAMLCEKNQNSNLRKISKSTYLTITLTITITLTKTITQ